MNAAALRHARQLFSCLPLPYREHVVRDTRELDQCRAEFERRSGGAVELAYLERARCRAFYARGRLVAFYAVHVAPTPELRYFGWLPASARPRLAAIAGPVAELACLFIDRAVPAVPVYFHAIADLLASRAPLAMAGSVVAQKIPTYAHVFPHELYRGPSSFGPGCWIGLGSSHALWPRTLQMVPLHVVRRARRAQRSKPSSRR